MEFCSLYYHKFLKKVNSFFQIYDKKERSPVLFPSNSHDVVGQHQVIFPPRQRPIEDGSDLAHAFRTVAVYAVANPVHIDERALFGHCVGRTDICIRRQATAARMRGGWTHPRRSVSREYFAVGSAPRQIQFVINPASRIDSSNTAPLGERIFGISPLPFSFRKRIFVSLLLPYP